eukprot:574589_1
MNATIFPSYNIGVNGNYPPGQMIMNPSQTQSNTVETTINDTEISLIHQQLQEELMQDALIYERIRKSHSIKQLQRQKADMKQRGEGNVMNVSGACDCKFCHGFVHFVSNQIQYSIISALDSGTYSRVFECRRMDNNCACAMKLIQMTAMHEIDILKRIKANDLDDTSCCIHIADAGFYFRHPMFVFPLLSNSLRSSITPHHPFSHSQITHLMWQMCRAVAFIHSLGIINTDLKPDNIMFVGDESDLKIKIIDFGAAVFDKASYSHMIQTREYRAPEVILAKKWSFEVDIWSLGCILTELVCGKLLFPSHSNANHLHQIIECIGTPPSHLCDVIEKDVDFGITDPNLNSNCGLRSYFGLTNHQESNTYDELYDLCTQMLRWDAKERITATKALQHPVFKHCM